VNRSSAFLKVEAHSALQQGLGQQLAVRAIKQALTPGGMGVVFCAHDETSSTALNSTH
jgi:aspartate aminotransferase-like enzyme